MVEHSGDAPVEDVTARIAIMESAKDCANHQSDARIQITGFNVAFCAGAFTFASVGETSERLAFSALFALYGAIIFVFVYRIGIVQMFHYDLFKRIRDDLCSGLSKTDIVSQCNDDMEICARQFPVFGSRIMNGSYLIFWPAINFLICAIAAALIWVK